MITYWMLCCTFLIIRFQYYSHRLSRWECLRFVSFVFLVISLVFLTSAVSSTAIQLVSVVTHTAEHSRQVLACSEHADVLEVALINICESGNRKGVWLGICLYWTTGHIL